ncbi:MAG: tetratricopeptide repeat protein [Eubacterium sp.]|nr:tetratricopeptide repeat protein [Eubacterium sp.]
MVKTENITCPGCGEPWTLNMKECPACHRPVVISTFNSVYSMSAPEANKYANTYKKILSDDPDNAEVQSSIAMCYLKLKLYDKALSAFEQAIEADFDNSETYFYAAVCLLKGKKAFLAQRSDIDKALEYINAALMIEPKGIYYYFLAYINYDFFERKYLNTSPDYRECLQLSIDFGTSDFDKDMLFNVLGIASPSF